MSCQIVGPYRLLSALRGYVAEPRCAEDEPWVLNLAPYSEVTTPPLLSGSLAQQKQASAFMHEVLQWVLLEISARWTCSSMVLVCHCLSSGIRGFGISLQRFTKPPVRKHGSRHALSIHSPADSFVFLLYLFEVAGVICTRATWKIEDVRDRLQAPAMLGGCI